MEPSREDRYEAAVRAVLDLCDEAEDSAITDYGPPPMVTTAYIRQVIKDALLVDDDEGTDHEDQG